ncbi:MAG: porin family protein [Prevotellaceae bacterium]|jgi:long-chain fatty acid transport protein|nr:porin family protein [Prevotellaceae bacterium]
MKKLSLISLLLLITTIPAFAGGLLTNTNQHIAFLRMLARGASTEIDGVYSNPAGLSFLPHEGLYLSLNIQNAYQTRLIDATVPGIFPEANATRHYKGTASAPIIPSFQAAYKTGNWVFSGSFAVVGGGGKASFDTGLPIFDAMAIGMINSQLAQHPQLGQLIAAGIPPTSMYSMNSSLDGKQYIYGVQLGVTYKVKDWFSAFVGGRMNYFTGGYEGFLRASLKNEYGGAQVANIALDCTQTGWGLTPIIGADFKLNKWNIGLKYEFMAELNIENKTKTLDVPADATGAFAAYENGVNTPNDIPALLTAAVGYEFLPTLRASVEYHYFFDKDAGMAGDKQKTLTGGTNEFLVGAEWDAHKYVTVSAGYQKTDYGLADNFQSDTAFSCDSYSIGVGAALNLSKHLKLNLAYFWTTYSDYTKKMDKYNGMPVAGTNVYGRTNRVFGVGVDYNF